jgi:hypothetical protein
MLTQERLKELLNYDSATGIFTWKIKTVKTNIGEIAGSITHNGYIRIGVDYRDYLAHQLAWLFHYGEFPKITIDHIDRKTSNNKISNLRIITKSENMANANIRIDNKSGHKGVRFNKKDNKWRSKISKEGKEIYLGSFSNIEDAIAVRKKAEIDFFPTINMSGVL